MHDNVNPAIATPVPTVAEFSSRPAPRLPYLPDQSARTLRVAAHKPAKPEGTLRRLTRRPRARQRG